MLSSSSHAVLASGSAPQWGVCAGSIRAQADIPNPETERSRAGTATHWVVSETLEAARTGCAPPCRDFVGRTAPNGVVIDAAMADGAQVMVDDVLEVCERFNCHDRLLIEQRVNMPAIHEQNWGTLDAGLYLPERGLLFLWDYKHGHRSRHPRGDLQLINYMAGLVEYYDIDDQATTFIARIVQPYAYSAEGPVKEWYGVLSELRPDWNTLHNKAAEAVGAAPRLTTGPHCRDCRAVGTCAAVRNAQYNFIELVNEPYTMDDMRGADLAVERAIVKDGLAVAKARLAAIEVELETRITNGDKTTGLAVRTAPGRLEWSCPPAQALALCAQFGVDISRDVVLTPTQAKAAAPKNVRPLLGQVVAEYTRRPAGSLKLIPADDKPAANAFKRKD